LSLNSGNVSQLNDRVGSSHAAQATAINQPLHHASGGPGGCPYIELQDVDRTLAATVSHGAANRVGMYAVLALGGSSRSVCQAANGAFITGEFYNGSSHFEAFAEFSGGTQVALVTTPAFGSGWHLHALRPLSTGARYEIDGTLASPNLTGTDTLKAINTQRFGEPGNAAGSFAFCIYVDTPTDAKDAMVKAYVRRRFGLAIS
jgi:hypothetical protein